MTSLEHVQLGILNLVSGVGKGAGLTRVKKLDKGRQGGGRGRARDQRVKLDSMWGGEVSP